MKTGKETGKKKTYANIDEIQDALRDLTDDEMDDFLERKYGAIEEPMDNMDSDAGNIIRFKPRNPKTFH